MICGCENFFVGKNVKSCTVSYEKVWKARGIEWFLLAGICSYFPSITKAPQ